jgi:hypothetical protein
LVQFAKVAVLVTFRIVLFVFVPQKLQGDVLAFQFLEQILHRRHDRLFTSRPVDFLVKALFKLPVIDIVRQRPGDPGLFGQCQILSHGDMGHGAAFGNFTVGQLVLVFEP